MLSEQEVEVLGRYRTSDYSKFKGNLDLAQIMRDQEHLCRAMLRLYPPGWNEPVTPERLVELGFAIDRCGRYVSPNEVLWWTPGSYGSSSYWRVGGAFVVSELEPRNMLEARQLLERCGAIKETK